MNYFKIAVLYSLSFSALNASEMEFLFQDFKQKEATFGNFIQMNAHFDAITPQLLSYFNGDLEKVFDVYLDKIDFEEKVISALTDERLKISMEKKKIKTQLDMMKILRDALKNDPFESSAPVFQKVISLTENGQLALEDGVYHRIYLLGLFNVVASQNHDLLESIYGLLTGKEYGYTFHEKVLYLIGYIDHKVKKPDLASLHFSLWLTKACGLNQDIFEKTQDFMEEKVLSLSREDGKLFEESIVSLRQLLFPKLPGVLKALESYEEKAQKVVTDLFQSINSALENAKKIDDPETLWEECDVIIATLSSYPLEGLQKAKMTRKIELVHNQRMEALIHTAFHAFFKDKDDERAEKFYDFIFEKVQEKGFDFPCKTTASSGYVALFFHAGGEKEKALKWADYILKNIDTTGEKLLPGELLPVTALHYLYTWMGDKDGLKKIKPFYDKVLSSNFKGFPKIIENFKNRMDEFTKKCQFENVQRREMAGLSLNALNPFTERDYELAKEQYTLLYNKLFSVSFEEMNRPYQETLLRDQHMAFFFYAAGDIEKMNMYTRTLLSLVSEKKGAFSSSEINAIASTVALYEWMGNLEGRSSFDAAYEKAKEQNPKLTQESVELAGNSNNMFVDAKAYFDDIKRKEECAKAEQEMLQEQLLKQELEEKQELERKKKEKIKLEQEKKRSAAQERKRKEEEALEKQQEEKSKKEEEQRLAQEKKLAKLKENQEEEKLKKQKELEKLAQKSAKKAQKKALKKKAEEEVIFQAVSQTLSEVVSRVVSTENYHKTFSKTDSLETSLESSFNLRDEETSRDDDDDDDGSTIGDLSLDTSLSDLTFKKTASAAQTILPVITYQIQKIMAPFPTPILLPTTTPLDIREQPIIWNSGVQGIIRANIFYPLYIQIGVIGIIVGTHDGYYGNYFQPVFLKQPLYGF